jgi:hypothetical protein
MVTSILLRKAYKIGVNSKGNIKLGDETVSIKDIPFVRYRFDSYTDEDIRYINEMHDKLTYSTHMIEVDALKNKGDISSIREDSVIFLYIGIDDTNVNNESIGQENIEAIGKYTGYNIERVMIKDKSSSLDYMTLSKMIGEVSKITGIKKDKIGICGSPLSFNEDMMCLSATRAREIMTKYNGNTEVALPTAKHQCMECCGCIKYIEIEQDILAVETSNTQTNTQGAVKKIKTNVSPFGRRL